MAQTDHNPLLSQIRQLIGMELCSELSDSQLLERFNASRDETAIGVLVRRYGPLVLGVCRKVLHNADAAEDAFQATFLVLVRKTPALAGYQPLGGWLYRVAYRLALRARANDARRRQCEARAARRRVPIEEQASAPSDLIVALEVELDRLPSRHRTPLSLCYFEGKTNEQAAQILGCPAGSMSARLAQARERLRCGLARRGFIASSVAITAALAAAESKAAVPLPLLANTVRAAVWFAGENAGLIGQASAGAVALARSACNTMLVHKLKIAAAALLFTAVLGTGTILLLRAAVPSGLASQVSEQPPSGARPDRPGTLAEGLPTNVVARMGSTQLRHGDAVFFAAYMPDGASLVTAGKDRSIRQWDLATAKELQRFDWGQVPEDSPPDPFAEDLNKKHERRVLEDLALSTLAALAPNGRTLAASRDGVVCLWETATGKQLRRFQTGQEQMVHLAFSPDCQSLLTVSASGRSTALWEVATGKCIRHSQAKMPSGYSKGLVPFVEQNVFTSPNLKFLAYQWRDPSGIRRIHIRDLERGKEMAAIDTGGYGGPLPMSFSADSKTLLWKDWYFAGGIVFSEVSTGRELRRLGDRRHGYGDVAERTEPALALAISPDGKHVATCSGSHAIELWNVASGKVVYPAGPPTQAQLVEWFDDYIGAEVRPALAFSPDSKKLVCSLGRATVRQFRADTGAEISGAGFDGRASVSTLALSKDGKALYTFGSGDSARSWDWSTGHEKKLPGLPANAMRFAFADEERFAYSVGNSVTLCRAGKKKTWRIASGEFPPLQTLAITRDGTLLATRSYDTMDVHLWDAEGRKRFTLSGPGDGPISKGSPGLAETAGVVTPEVIFSPDGRLLAGAGPRMRLCLWDLANGALLWQVPPEAGQVIERLAFSQTGHCLATVHADRTVTLYEVASGASRGHLGRADLKNRRVYLAYDYYGRTRLSDATRRAPPICLAFSPDDRYLAMAKETPVIELWDVLAGREVGRLKGHKGGVVSLLFAPDGKHLFSGGTDTTALTWDLSQIIQPAIPQATTPDTATLTTLWADLAGQDAERAFDALRKLSASPDQAVTLIREHLLPATLPDAGRLDQLLADLASEEFNVRRHAEEEFFVLGAHVEPALRKALDAEPSLELRQRLGRLLGKLSLPAGDQLRALRAVELLELIGNADARHLLGALAGGEPSLRLTQEADRALHRLTK
jgi:RNA polymerase sigma factor (sigma-70 family)